MRQDGGQVVSHEDAPRPPQALWTRLASFWLIPDAMCSAFAAAYEVNGLQLTEPEARTITNRMLQKVRLRLATLASSAEDP